MRLLLATNHLGLGGSESYLRTVAEQLDRLAHEVLVYAPELGNGVDLARERGLTVEGGIGSITEPFDAALVQDSGVSHELADQFPQMPQIFICHSTKYDLQAPPQLSDVVAAVVVLNDRVGSRVSAFSTQVEVVRLRQPIDTERFLPGGVLPAQPRRALLVSNNPNDDRQQIIEAACSAADIDLERLGRDGQVADPRSALAEADMVIGYGRSILEAMACGRAAYVYDWTGSDGWVTAESYTAIEADGIAGGTGRQVVDADRLAVDLRAYDSGMGPVNRDLIMTHHRASVHAQELIEIVNRVASPESRPRGPLQEMARLVRLEWRARDDVRSLQRENVHLRELLRHNQEATERVVGELRESEAAVHEMRTSSSWRITRPLRSLGLLRRRRRHRA